MAIAATDALVRVRIAFAVARAPVGGARAAVCTRRDDGVRRADRAVRRRGSAFSRWPPSHFASSPTKAAARALLEALDPRYVLAEVELGDGVPYQSVPTL